MIEEINNLKISVMKTNVKKFNFGEFKDNIDLKSVAAYQNISEGFMKEVANQKLSEEFMEEFKDKIIKNF
jgi:hypothetical protein